MIEKDVPFSKIFFICEKRKQIFFLREDFYLVSLIYAKL
jgi:hypothetical protein